MSSRLILDYELTRRRRSLWSALEPVRNWAQTNVDDIVSAQEKFDRKRGAANGNATAPKGSARA